LKENSPYETPDGDCIRRKLEEDPGSDLKRKGCLTVISVPTSGSITEPARRKYYLNNPQDHPDGIQKGPIRAKDAAKVSRSKKFVNR
jgi:hypothetical protein